MTRETTARVCCQSLNKSYVVPGREGLTRQVLQDVSFKACDGELVSVVGPSGSGKSTLLYCLSGLESCDDGKVELCGVDITQLSLPDISRLRRDNVGFVFQDYNLIQSLTSIENLMLPAQLSGADADPAAAKALLNKLGLSNQINAKPQTLSGGEQQRVAVARILFNQSKIVFADEPTGALDSQASKVIANLLREAARAGSTVVIVTHDIELAAQSDRVLVLYDGRVNSILEHPSPREVFETLNMLNNGNSPHEANSD